MRRWAYSLIFYCVIAFVCLEHAFAADRVAVFVSIAPQKYFVQQIGKDLVDVQAMVPPGASPATYEPKPRQMAALSKTQIYFAIGVPFENTWLNKIAAANPEMKVVHTDEGIEKLAMAGHDHDAAEGEHHTDQRHARAAQGSHQHGSGGLDPHIWLSPPLVKIQARTILAALQENDPAHRRIYEDNFREFAARIDQLDNDLQKTFAGRPGLTFIVFHPSWGYFAQAYGLHQVAIEIEGKSPKPAQLTTLIQQARKRGIRVVFVQPQFATKSAALVAREIGGQVAIADPLAEDWMANLRAVSEKLKAALP
jgi:zinc transport system substrate-binding protein